jgi:hypothetical protein
MYPRNRAVTLVVPNHLLSDVARQRLVAATQRGAEIAHVHLELAGLRPLEVAALSEHSTDFLVAETLLGRPRIRVRT